MRLSRRAALLVASSSLAELWGGGLACEDRKREAWATGPRLRNNHPILRMPFPAGTAVLCQQGNLSPAGRTHSKDNCRHALDLSNTSVPSVPVVAAAPGRVGYVYAEAKPGDSKGGLGFGNHVKVEHGGGYFTMYAHLDEVHVNLGDVIDSAAPLGTIGFTGAAGNRHLHFSLHQGNPAGMGVYETIAMDALIAADLSADEPFRSMSSALFRDGISDLWRGSLYGSENRPASAPLVGAPPPDINAALQTSRRLLEQGVHDRTALDDISAQWEASGDAWAHEKLDPILARAPRHAVARYWLATLLTRDRRPESWKKADDMLNDLLATGPSEATWETWLSSWMYNRKGELALKRGDAAAALAHFVQGANLATAEPERAFAVAQIRRLRAAPSATP